MDEQFIRILLDDMNSVKNEEEIQSRNNREELKNKLYGSFL